MDSELLNVFCDNSNIEYYSSNDNDVDLLGMQQLVTETLNGILPIPPTENFHIDDDNTTLFNINAFKCNDEGHFTTENVESTTSNIYGDIDNAYCDYQHLFDCGGDDNEDQQSQCSNNTFPTRTDSSSIGDYESDTSDFQDIGDLIQVFGNNYNDVNCEGNDEDNEREEAAFYSEDPVVFEESSKCMITKDSVTISAPLNMEYINNDCSPLNIIPDINDPTLDLDVDVNNFDLTEFITQDDITLSPLQVVNSKGTTIIPSPSSKKNIQNSNDVMITSMNSQSDTDSDVIIDVETVEVNDQDCPVLLSKVVLAEHVTAIDNDEHENDNENSEDAFVDIIKTDPMWTPPKPCKSSNKRTNNSHSKINKKCIKSSNIEEGEYETDRILHKSFCDNDSSSSTLKKAKQNDCDRHDSKKQKVNNLLESTIECSRTLKGSTSGQLKISHNNCNSERQAVKRKLNLEEYKNRRCDQQQITKNSHTSNILPGMEKSLDTGALQIRKSIPSQPKQQSHNVEIASIVKSLKEEQHNLDKSKVIDPITIAKSKVLKMRELKRAQQLRILDSTISAKVPKVTKLPPLKEIVKDTEYYLNETDKSINQDTTENKNSKSEYEEITIISIQCNTDITIPPFRYDDRDLKLNKAQSLLKSTVLLANITNTTDNIKIHSNSLIASIQEVVVKKVVNENRAKYKNLQNEYGEYYGPEHHGEDKIIMHLRKDRIRPTVNTVGVQTDFLTQFPQLTSSSLICKSQVKHRVKQRHKARKSRYDSCSDHLTDSEQSDAIISRYHSREDSCSSSVERSQIYDSAIGMGYSSRSSNRNRSSVSSSRSESYKKHAEKRGQRQRRTSYKKRRRPHSNVIDNYSSTSSRSSISSTEYSDSDAPSSNHARDSRFISNSGKKCSKRQAYKNDKNKCESFEPAVEERRIVYVGHIEAITTKKMLRRKFSTYGNVEHISIHYKQNGMKYGFVTFERAQDAFAAIDNSKQNSQINMYDVSFGGRRAFCRASYADLDNAGSNAYHHSYEHRNNSTKYQEDSFDALLMKVKAKLNANKSSSNDSNYKKDNNKI